jgi:Ca-activated chloride channel family protein
VGIYTAAAIILLTDGASNIGPTPYDSAVKAAEKGIRIFTIGMGKAKTTSSYNYANQDQLDEDILKLIASKTYAEYFRAENSNQLKKIYENLGIQLVHRPENTDLSPLLTGLATVLAIMAGLLSLFWFSSIP